MKKKFANRNFYILVVFLLCSCVGGDNQTMQGQLNSPTVTVHSESDIERMNPTAHIPTPTSQITAVIGDTPQNKIPVALSFFQVNGAGYQIVSVLLGQNIEYPVIPIENKKTIFLGPAAIDSQNNLYLIYGQKENYISKLSPDGTVTTKPVPFDKSSQAVWIGETFVVVPIHSTKPTYIVDTQLNIKEITPSLNVVTDAVPNNTGFLGIADAADNLAIWVFTRPVRTEIGYFAHYRTLDSITGETLDGLLPIPAHAEDFTQTNDPADRLGTLVYGVDPTSQHVLLCYGISSGNNSISTVLELYASQSGRAIQQEDRCCLNNIFDLRGDTFIENHTPETCSGRTIQNWSDMESAIDTQLFMNSPKQNNAWIVSNGIYWVIKTDQKVAVFNTDKVLEAEYILPAQLNGLTNGTAFQIGLLMMPY